MTKRGVSAVDLRRGPARNLFLGERVELALGGTKQFQTKFQIIQGGMIPTGISTGKFSGALDLGKGMFAALGASGKPAKGGGSYGPIGSSGGVSISGGASAGAAGGGKKGGDGDDRLSRSNFEGPTFFSWSTFKAIATGIVRAYRIVDAFIEYKNALSLIANGKAKEAVEHFESAISSFMKAEQFKSAGELGGKLGFMFRVAIFDTNLKKNNALRAQHSYSAFMAAYEAYKAAGDNDNTAVCAELAVQISREMVTTNSVMQQVYDLPINDQIHDDALRSVIAQAISEWRSALNSPEELALRYGLPAKVSELPVALLAETLMNNGRYDLAEIIMKETGQANGSDFVAVKDVLIIKWLMERAQTIFPGESGLDLTESIKKKLPKLSKEIKERLGDDEFRERYLRTGRKGERFIDTAGIYLALEKIFGLDSSEILAIPGKASTEVDDRDPSEINRSNILGALLSSGKYDGRQLDKLIGSVIELLGQERYSRYHLNGIASPDGILAAIAEVTGASAPKTKPVHQRTKAEIRFEEQSLVVTGVTSPRDAILAILEMNGDQMDVRFNGWKDLSPDIKDKALLWIGRRIITEQKQNRAKQIFSQVQGHGFRIDPVALSMIIKQVEEMQVIEKTLYDQLIKLDETERYRIVDNVRMILQRENFDGHTPSNIMEAYRIYNNGGSR